MKCPNCDSPDYYFGLCGPNCINQNCSNFKGPLNKINEPTCTIDQDGTKKWYQNGGLHRLDGPAVEWPYGTKEWWQNGERHRKDGPAIEWAGGSKHWFQNGERHREDGPAVVESGHKHWYQNGRRHRKDGPAIEWADGSKEWWVNGKRLSEEDFNHTRKGK